MVEVRRLGPDDTMPTEGDFVYISRTPKGGFLANGSIVGTDGAIFYTPAAVDRLEQAIQEAKAWASKHGVLVIYVTEDAGA